MEEKKPVLSRSLSYHTWQRLISNKLSLIGLVIIGVFISISILGYLITPDSTPQIQQIIEIIEKSGIKTTKI